jgi:ABC-type methionine transport system permease subunit
MQTSQTMIGNVIILRTLALVFLIFLLQGCTALVVGAVVGTVATVAVEVVKVPFKVGGAVVDVVTDDEEEDE